MTYTIADIEQAIEDAEDLFERDLEMSGWAAFEEVVQSNLEPVLDAEGNQVQETSRYGNYLTPKFRDKGWTGFDLPGVGRASHIQTIGGEGQGDGYELIFSIEDADGIRIFKRDGYYSSYEGSNLEDGVTREVEQAEKTVKYWKAI